MEITEKFFAKNRTEWRKWLKQNYNSEKEIWLVFFNKKSGRKGITYDEAVEEALCFGWIDSIAKKNDPEYYVQRFTPRKPKSPYSQLNKERLKKLLRQKKVIAAVRRSLGDLPNEKFIFPGDIIDELRKNKEAWQNFQTFSDAYKRIRVAFIDGARNRPEEFRKRLNYFIKMTAANKMYGINGIEKYF